MDVEAARRELNAAREALVMVEHGADDSPAMDRYVKALERWHAALGLKKPPGNPAPPPNV